MTLTIEAPTDAQLGYITDLCAKKGLRQPEVIASKQEAGRIIDAIRNGTYGADEYAWPWGVPFR